MKLWRITLDDGRIYLVGGIRNIEVVDAAEHKFKGIVVDMEYIGETDMVVM